jgi:hypothetical protein
MTLQVFGVVERKKEKKESGGNRRTPKGTL